MKSERRSTSNRNAVRHRRNPHYFGNFSKYGDFSYGIYIVHWPILQVLIVFGLARMNAYMFLLVSLSIIGLAGSLMWHLVESRFLASSSHYRQTSLKAPA